MVRAATGSTWSPWRSVVVFGLVSLAADMVYEGMRSVVGPFLGSLGASALTVGVVTGAGEAIALALRVVTGAAADRSGRHWQLTTVGYGLTAVSVPLLAVAPFVGGAGVVAASVLVLVERTGKAVRSPSKSALLAGMAKPVGRGRGFAVHKALDQVGAFAGPLLLAGLAALTGRLWLGFVVLAVPGVVSLVLLGLLRRYAPVEPAPPRSRPARGADGALQPPQRLPRAFYMFAGSCAAGTIGLMTFGVISFAIVDHGLLTADLVPLAYAGAMALEALAALATGFAYDRLGAGVLYMVPVLVALVPALVFGHRLGAVLVGLGIWAAATGVQESTVKALVAALVPSGTLATAYGAFAAAQGSGALIGGVLAGALYRDHLGVLVVVVGAAQVASLLTLVISLRVDKAAEPQTNGAGGT